MMKTKCFFLWPVVMMVGSNINSDHVAIAYLWSVMLAIRLVETQKSRMLQVNSALQDLTSFKLLLHYNLPPNSLPTLQWMNECVCAISQGFSQGSAWDEKFVAFVLCFFACLLFLTQFWFIEEGAFCPFAISSLHQKTEFMFFLAPTCRFGLLILSLCRNSEGWTMNVQFGLG